MGREGERGRVSRGSREGPRGGSPPAGSLMTRSKGAGMRPERSGREEAGPGETCRLGAPSGVGATSWGGGDQQDVGGDPQGLVVPPPSPPTHCSVTEPPPSQCPPLPGSSHVPICPPRSSCVLAFVSHPCCRPAPISFCPINPRHESRRQKGCNLIRALLNPHCSPG